MSVRGVFEDNRKHRDATKSNGLFTVFRNRSPALAREQPCFSARRYQTLMKSFLVRFCGGQFSVSDRTTNGPFLTMPALITERCITEDAARRGPIVKNTRNGECFFATVSATTRWNANCNRLGDKKTRWR